MTPITGIAAGRRTSASWLAHLLAMLVLGLGLALSAAPGVAGETKPSGFSTIPQDHEGRPWRIAYYEGGSHGNYYEYLHAVVGGLAKLGWIDVDEVPRTAEKDTGRLWEWLARNASGRYVEFLADGFYSAGWDLEARDHQRRSLVARFKERADVDLVFAMGTWAGKDLATDEHRVSTIVMSTSDPVQSGIIGSIHDSGRKHVHARVDPQRYERQVRVFHDVIGFRRLGVAYEDSPDGRNYAAMDTVERVAAERGFELVRCFTQSDVANQTLANRSVVECFQKLARKVDAIYVTLQGGVNRDTIPKLVEIANAYRVPTFSQAGSREVKNGFLLSISRPSFKPVGRFLAATVAKVLNGAQPGELTQLYEEAPSIAINLKTAELIGLYLYADVLAAADEIYRDIQNPL